MDWAKAISDAIAFLNSPAWATTVKAIEAISGLIGKLAETHPTLVTNLGNAAVQRLGTGAPAPDPQAIHVP